MAEPEQNSGANESSSCDNDKDTMPDEQTNAQKGKNANSWQRKYEKQKKTFDSEKRALQEEINSLQSQQKYIKCENGNLMSKLQEAEIINKSLQEQVQVLNRNNQSLTEQKDDLILSTMPDEQTNAQKGKHANSWQRKYEKQKKTFDSVKRELQEEINSLKSQHKSIKRENGNLMSKLQEAEIIKKSLREQVQVLNRNSQSLIEQKDDLILRLSKLTVDNSNIADLSDSKRPTKLAEEFAELYDNEWTDAFENIHFESEQEKIAFMLKLLQSARQICNDVSRRHMEDMKKGIFTLTVDTKTSSEKLSSEQNAIKSCDKSEKAECECHESEDKRKRLKVDAFDSGPLEEYEVIECVEVLSCEEPSKEISAHAGSHKPKVHVIADDVSTFSAAQKQAILEIKKDVEERLSKQLQKVVTNIVAIKNNVNRQTQDSTIKYIAKCVDICWSMCQHEPPVFFDFPETVCETFLDENVYKLYTKSGNYIAFIVWPALYLYRGGPLLEKGVAQGRMKMKNECFPK